MTILDSLTPQIANNSFVTLTCAQPHCVTPPLRVHMHQGHLLFENAAAGGHLRISAKGAVDYAGGRGPWARFDAWPDAAGESVCLKCVGHGERGSDVFLAAPDDGRLGAAQHPVYFKLLPAAPPSAAPAADALPPPPPASLTAEQRAAFVADGFVVVPGAVDAPLVDDALRAINSTIGAGPSAWTHNADGEDIVDGGARGHAAVMALLYRSKAHGLAESLLGVGKLTAPRAAQLALRWPAPPERAARGGARPDEQWHIDGMKKPHMTPFQLLLGVALSETMVDDAGNLGVWPKSHVPIHAAVARARAKREGDGACADADADADAPEVVAGGAADSWLGERPVLGAGTCRQVHVRPGDVLLVHQKTAHRVSPNYSPHVRYMAYFRLANVEHAAGRDALGPLWRGYDGLREAEDLRVCSE